VITLLAAVSFAQGTFKPRNPDEDQAWRLYNQYLTTQKNIAQLKDAIKLQRSDINTTTKSSIGAAGADRQDVARLTKLRQQLTTEEEKLKNLENVWNQKFSGRYGALSDSAETIYDPQTKQTMDKIRFRIIYNRFDPNEKEPPSGKNGQWVLSDVKSKIQKDAGYTPTEWSGGETSVTGVKRYRANGADKELMINASFYWLGIPKMLRPNETIKVKVHLNQSVNTETGYDVWIKMYSGQVGGVEADGPEVALSWRDAGKSTSAEGSLVVGNRTDKPFQIRVFCKIGQDNYQVFYTYLFNQTQVASPANDSGKASNKIWNGDWQTKWGKMVIVQTGNEVTGTYEHDNGKIKGVIVGDKIIGTWSEAPTYLPPNDAGEFEMILSSDGQSFTGRWRYGTTGRWEGGWNGNRYSY
jgi:hypothetical protein